MLKDEFGHMRMDEVKHPRYEKASYVATGNAFFKAVVHFT